MEPENDTRRVMLETELLLPEIPDTQWRYPASLPHPHLHARWDDEDEATLVFIEIGDIAMHLEVVDDDVAWHLHVGGHDGPPLDGTPWDASTTDALLLWAAEFAEKAHACLAFVEDDVFDAIDLFEAGATFAPFSGVGMAPEELAGVSKNDFKIFHVESPGHPEPQIWTGNGDGMHLHPEDRDGEAELLWTPPGAEEHIHIGAVLINEETGLPGTFASPGVNWGDVGMTETDAMDWLLREHRNCEWASEVHDLVIERILDVLAGFDTAVVSTRR